MNIAIILQSEVCGFLTTFKHDTHPSTSRASSAPVQPSKQSLITRSHIQPSCPFSLCAQQAPGRHPQYPLVSSCHRTLLLHLSISRQDSMTSTALGKLKRAQRHRLVRLLAIHEPAHPVHDAYRVHRGRYDVGRDTRGGGAACRPATQSNRQCSIAFSISRTL